MKYYCSENRQDVRGTKCTETSIQCPVFEDDRCCANCSNVDNCGYKCGCLVQLE